MQLAIGVVLTSAVIIPSEAVVLASFVMAILVGRIPEEMAWIAVNECVVIAFATRWMGFGAVTTEDAFGLAKVLILFETRLKGVISRFLVTKGVAIVSQLTLIGVGLGSKMIGVGVATIP
jgi:hypothetical protein